jgi:diguanylate cyclase (GGDEF)-like protein
MNMAHPTLPALHWLDRHLDHLSSRTLLLLAIAVLSICTFADHYTGNELSFSITYLAPIALAAWYAGAKPGFFMVFAASLAWLGVDLLSGHTYSHPMIPVWNSLVRLGFFLIVTTLLLHTRKLLTILHDQAGQDALTGLANSRTFYARLNLERERALRYRHPFTIAYLDLDNFKRVNDTLGHEAGDGVLRTIAEGLTSGLRKTDLIARLGGDEFALLLAETGEGEADEVLQKLHVQLLRQMALQKWPVGCSIGAVTCNDPTQIDSHDLVNQADELMYLVKRSGKNRIVCKVIG